MFELPNNFSGSRVPGTTTSEPRWRHAFNLDDLPWLGDFRVQNKSVIPTSLFLVIIVAAAVDISNGKQVNSIEISDVAIGSSIIQGPAPVRIETSFSITSLNNSLDDGVDSIQAEFSLNESPAQDRNTPSAAKGKLRISFAHYEPPKTSSSFCFKEPNTCGLIPVNIDQFYNSLSEIGLSYIGRLRCLTSAERRMDFARAVLVPTADEIPGLTLLHSTSLEVCLQTLLLAFAAPRDASLWTAFTPTHITRLTFFPNLSVGFNASASVTIYTYLQKYTPGYEAVLPRISGDSSVYCSETGRLQMRIEGLTMSPVTPSTKEQDKLLYLKTTWQQDILSGVRLEQDNCTSNYEGSGLSQVQRYILAATRQISHRYAKSKILQVGISSINLVEGICQCLGQCLDSYTIVDASYQAIVDMKREMLSDHPAIKFGVLDISRGDEVLDEAKVPGSADLGTFDLVILQGFCRENRGTFEYIRTMLKLGGFLLMTMSPTDAFSLKATDTSFGESHEKLQDVGFSVIGASEKDTEGSFVILSQSVDDQIAFLAAPLDTQLPFATKGTLLVIGGYLTKIQGYLEIIQSRLKCIWEGEIVAIRSLADLNSININEVAAVLTLTELDQSVLKDLSPDTFKGLHHLLDKSKVVLWVTHGARNQNPHQTGTIGLVRAVQAESPEKVLQILDLDEIDGTESIVAESFLRLIGGVLMRDNGSNRLWTVEPELSFQGRGFFIPRVLFDKKRNDRLNSFRRRIEARDIDKADSGSIIHPIDPSGLFSPSKTYVLVGLSGHIGQSITRWMVQNGARHVAITSRCV
jgi:hypothetical protein